MNDRQSADRLVDEALRAIAEEDARMGASPAVEAHVMVELRAAAAARRRRLRVVVSALAAAAAVALAATIPWSRLRSGENPSGSTPSATAGTRWEVTTAFMPLTYSGVPIVDGHVVRMEVPRASLVSFGLVPADGMEGAASGTVLADVVVGDDGLARAVRFVRRLPLRKD